MNNLRRKQPSEEAFETERARCRLKVAFIFSHQIQYFTNILQALNERGNIDLRVYYAHHTNKFKDKGFGRAISWNNQSGNEFQSIVLPDSGRRAFCGFHSSVTAKLFPALSTYDPDIVHLNGYGTAIQWIGWAWGMRNRKLIVARGDGDTFANAVTCKRTFSKFIARRFTHHLDQVLYQGKENKLYWKERGADDERMTWVPCVPDNRIFRRKAFPNDAARDRFRADVGVKTDDCVFVVSGKLDQRKRPTDALKAISQLNGKPCKLWFLGSGPLQEELTGLAASLKIEHCVHWWGFRNVSELPAVLQAADVLLHLSQRDPWPYSILEGAMSGLALLLSDKTGSHPDLIGDAGAGLTFQCGDIDNLVQQMKFLMEHREERDQFAAAALARCDRHTESVFCNAFEAAIMDLAGSNMEKGTGP